MLSNDDTLKLASAVRMHARGIVSEREVIGLLRDVANRVNISDVLPLLPDDLAAQLSESIARQPALKAVGYWWSHPNDNFPADGQFPDPTLLVSPSWCETERGQIVAYLQGGHTYSQWRGLSYCRFECGIPDSDMGSRCLTDGVWVWPEGLAHFIDYHNVRLPDEFVGAMRHNDWQVPQEVGGVARREHGLPDPTFWINWGKQTNHCSDKPGDAENQLRG
jgi:hypothetical protein